MIASSATRRTQSRLIPDTRHCAIQPVENKLDSTLRGILRLLLAGQVATLCVSAVCLVQLITLGR